MASVILVFPRKQNGEQLKKLLLRSGYEVAAVCTSGTAALLAADQLEEGIIVCGSRYPDMTYEQLYENVAGNFEMLLLASEQVISEGVPEGICSLAMPLTLQELTECLEEIVRSRRRKRRAGPRQRSGQERQVIEEAKILLMERNSMSEEEAHRYLQKISMDSGRNMAKTAEMLLSLMKSERE